MVVDIVAREFDRMVGAGLILEETDRAEIAVLGFECLIAHEAMRSLDDRQKPGKEFVLDTRQIAAIYFVSTLYDMHTRTFRGVNCQRRDLASPSSEACKVTKIVPRIASGN